MDGLLKGLARDFRYEPLPPEIRAVILKSWGNFGLLPAATVEKMVPEKPQRVFGQKK
jgi:hypothetical protein